MPLITDMEINEIINHLNHVAGTSFRDSSKKTRGLIRARVSDGFTVDDFRMVHCVKAADWLGTDFAKYLRPETLYGSKFESYLNQPMSDAQKLKMIMQATGKSATEVRDMMIQGRQNGNLAR